MEKIWYKFSSEVGINVALREQVVFVFSFFLQKKHIFILEVKGCTGASYCILQVLQIKSVVKQKM